MNCLVGYCAAAATGLFLSWLYQELVLLNLFPDDTHEAVSNSFKKEEEMKEQKN